jgi:multidrug efflux system outer membrane protein
MKQYIKLYALLILPAFLSACKVSKDIPLPQSAIPESFRGADTTDSSSIASISIKEFIVGEEILQLIDTALIRNYDMQLAVKNIAAAELLFKQAKLGNTPALLLQLTASSNRPSNNSLSGLSGSEFLGTNHIEDFNTNLGLSWEADIWGKISRQKQAALGSYLQTGEAKNAIQTRLIANIAQGYYRLLMMDSQLRTAQKNLALNDSTLRIIKFQYTAGQANSLAIQQAEAQRLVTAQLIPQLQQNIEIQENALRVLTGENPFSIKRSSTLEKIKMPVHLSAGIPSEMVGRRPDVKAFEYTLSMANARVGVSKANLYPSLTITASGGINSFKASNWFNIPASLFGVVTGGITQPVFQRRQLKTAYELAKIEREKVVIGFRQTVLIAVAEVADELVKIEKLKTQYTIANSRANVLRQAVTNAVLLFKSGMANYLEVITAQSNLVQSELELANVKAAQLNATVELYRSLGGGY